MPDEEYTCSVCKETYKKYNDEEWNDEKAKQELKDDFGEDEEPEDDCDIVCDDCYNDMVPKDKEIMCKTVLLKVGQIDKEYNVYTEECLKDIASQHPNLEYDPDEKALIDVSKVKLSVLRKRIADAKLVIANGDKSDPFKGLDYLIDPQDPELKRKGE